jgi:hypothetical protein
VVFDHRERALNTWGVGAIGSVRKERKTFTTVRSREGAGRLSWKPFGVRQSGEAGCAEAQTSEVRSYEVPEEIYTVDLRGEA